MDPEPPLSYPTQRRPTHLPNTLNVAPVHTMHTLLYPYMPANSCSSALAPKPTKPVRPNPIQPNPPCLHTPPTTPVMLQVLPDGSTLVAQDGSSVSGVDAIVFATGFDVTAPLSQFDIHARGQDLRQLLSVKPEGYYGLAFAGFPNLFTMIGPNTG